MQKTRCLCSRVSKEIGKKSKPLSCENSHPLFRNHLQYRDVFIEWPNQSKVNQAFFNGTKYNNKSIQSLRAFSFCFGFSTFFLDYINVRSKI